MKSTLVILLLLGLASVAYAKDMTKDDIIKTLVSNDLSSLVDLVQKNALILHKEGTTPNNMELKRNGAFFYDADASHAQYWYRGMGIAEANALVARGYSAINWDVDSFVGVAPMFSYAKKYVTHKNPGVVVEFGTDTAGWLSRSWSEDNTCQTKAEGGGTYGLGRKGSIRSCTQNKFPNPPVATLGQVFSDWMCTTTVTTRIVWVLVPR